MITKGMMSSDTNEWYTPPSLFDELDKEFRFTLDPCATKESAKCEKYYTKETNGLDQSWENESVFVNPPYGREIKHWVEKSYKESLKDNTQVVMLIPARTDTKYWHDYIFPYAKDIRFIKGRIKFYRIIHGEKVEGESAPFPSAIVIFGEREVTLF